MIATAVTFYDVAVWVHITAVVLAFGPTFAYGVFATFAERENGGAAAPTVGRAILAWNRTGTNLGMVVILLSGIYMAADGPYDFSEFFISWGLVAILALFGVVHGYFIPQTKKQIEIAERDLASPEGELSAEYAGMSQQVAKIGAATGIFLIITIYVMTAKPFL